MTTFDDAALAVEAKPGFPGTTKDRAAFWAKEARHGQRLVEATKGALANSRDLRDLAEDALADDGDDSDENDLEDAQDDIAFDKKRLAVHEGNAAAAERRAAHWREVA